MIPRRRTAVALTLAGIASGAVGSGVGISVGQDAPTTPADTGTSTTPPPEPTPPPPATTTATTPPPAPAPTPPPAPATTTATPSVSRAGSDAPTVAPVAPQRESGHRVRPPRPATTSTPSSSGGRSDAAGGDRKNKKKAKDGAATRAVPSRPTPATPGYSVALPGAAPIGVPNFFIDRFRIPPFLLPIYQAAGIQYGVRWEILAAINEIETDYGRNLNVSSAGAVGWMQFMPSTFKRWGVDANKDGVTDPYNPVDAIFSAARYLRAAGADTDIRKAIFAYNHANWYVDSVLMRARLVAGLPADLVGSLTGLTEGRFPVHARATYADRLTRSALRRAGRAGHAAVAVTSQTGRRGVDIYADAGAPVIAVQDGRIVATGTDARRGRWVKLRDLYGNSYVYEHLGSVVKRFPAPKANVEHDAKIQAAVARHRAAVQHRLARTARASATAGPTPVDAVRPAGDRRLAAHPTRQGALRARRAADALPLPAAAPGAVAHSVEAVQAAARQAAAEVVARRAVAPAAGDLQADGKQRIFAHPTRSNSYHAGGVHQLAVSEGEYTPYMRRLLGLPRREVVMRPLRRGATIVAGTVIGRVGKGGPRNPSHMRFTIRPAGRGAPLIDPKPILDGWKLLESTAIYRAAGVNALSTTDDSIGRVFLESKNVLAARVLNDSHIKIYDCGRSDIRNGLVDRRVLATLEFLRLSGLDPTVSALECGHGYYTSSGNVSEHSSGNAVDIAAINGIPIVGHQGPGSITDITIRRLLTLQGTMKPHQIISLMTFDGTDNTLALPDHYDHIHVGFAPEPGTVTATGGLSSTQWSTLMGRLSEIPNPLVPSAASESAIPAHATSHGSRRATRTSTHRTHAHRAAHATKRHGR